MSTPSENTGVNETVDHDSPSKNRTCRRYPNGNRPRRRWLIGACIATVLLIAAAVTCRGHGPHSRFGVIGWTDFNEAQVARMVDHLIDDATQAQKSKVTSIAQDAIRELAPLREQTNRGRTQLAQILSAPNIDRVALETLRTQQLSLADQASRVISKHIADAADVLTPEQRAELSQRFQDRSEY